MADTAQLIGDDIEYRGYVVARRPPGMPLGFWEEFVGIATAESAEDQIAAAEKEHWAELEKADQQGYDRAVAEYEGGPGATYSKLDEAYDAGARASGITPSAVDRLKEKLRRQKK